MTPEQLTQMDSVPVPDPTTLTTAALEREAANLKKNFDEGITNLAEKLQTDIRHRGELMGAQLEKIDLHFTMLEDQRKEQKTDTKTEVASAFAAAKEAVKEQTISSEKSISKSEAVTIEALKQLKEAFTAATEGDRRIVNGLKERIVVLETAKVGNPERERIVAFESERRGGKDNTAAIIAGIALLIIIVNVVINVVSAVAK